MPKYSECVEVVRRHLSEVVELEGDTPLGEKVDLVEELGLTSIEVMELIEQLEDTFDVAFPLNDLADVRTIDDLARHVEKLTESSE